MKKFLHIIFVLIVLFTIPILSKQNSENNHKILSRELGDDIKIEYLDNEIIIQTIENIISFPQNKRSANFNEVTINNIQLREKLISIGTVRVNNIFFHRYHYPDLDNYYLLKINSNIDPYDIADELKKNPIIKTALPNIILYPFIFPNDALFNYQWGLHNTGTIPGIPGTSGANDADIDAPEAWNIETGDNNVVVAVIDSGIDYTHPDLAANIWTNPGEIPNNNIDDDNNGYIDDYRGWDFYNDDNNPMDSFGHGTAVAGVISAVTNNNIGISGVCWNCKLMPIRILDVTFGNVMDIVDAIIYATDNGADITSNSWGGGQISYLAPLEAAFDYAKNNGVVSIAAAGNSNNPNPVAPAFYDSILAVASLNNYGLKSVFSNYGPWVDIAAPGGAVSCSWGLTDILTTIPTISFFWQSHFCYGGNFNNIYAFFGGTSLAAPFVSGTAALLLSKTPSLTVDQVYTLLRSGVDSALSNLYYIGEGRINAHKVLSYNLPAVAYLDSS
ncbi:MAG: S8 family peptidase, partial [Nanoarchaeota archaeon]